MTSAGQVAGATQQAAGTTAVTAKDEAAQVGQTAVSAVTDVAGTAKEQAAQVAGTAKDEVRELAGALRTQVNEQGDSATTAMGGTVRSLTEQLRAAERGEGELNGTLATLVRQLAEQGETLASYLDQSNPETLLSDVRSFASRRPGAFLLGALTLGVVSGRVLKGARQVQQAQTDALAGTPVLPVPAPVQTWSAPPVDFAPPVVPELPGVAGGYASAPDEPGTYTSATTAALGVPSASVVRDGAWPTPPRT